MAAPEEIARTYQQQQRGVIMAAIAAILALWRRLNEDQLTQSWQAGIGPSIVEVMTEAQLQAAALAPVYLQELAAAQGVAEAPLEVVPAALSGVASDGRPLESLLYQPIILFKRLMASGAQSEEAMRRATAQMVMIAATQAADAGRGAVDVGMTANRRWVSYVRVVSLPACSRCIILAGRTYSHSTGFERHPSCDCTMMPVTSEDVDISSPRSLFDQMSPEEQDRRFGRAGAEAIRLGADLGQVVNARRGMQTAGGRLVTTAGTSRRGIAGRRLRGQVRLMPETIIADAGGDREAAIRALRENGYLLDRPTVSAGRERVEIPRPRQPEPQQREVPSAARPFHRSLDGIEEFATAVEDGQPPANTRRLGGSSAVTELVTLADASMAIRKAARPGAGDLQDADSEQAAGLVARALGLRAPAVYRRRSGEVYMEYIADASTAEESAGDPRVSSAPASDEGALVGLLDLLTNNTDRNSGNWMVDASGRLVPIDHGMAYGDFITDGMEPTLEWVHSDFASRFKDPDRDEPVDNPLTEEDVAETRTRLEALRPDFEHLDRGLWLDYSLRMLDLLGERASGSRNLIAGVR